MMAGPSGYAPAPTTPPVDETATCGGCATPLRLQPDGWVHVIVGITGHPPAPWSERDRPIVTEAELRLLDGNR